MSDPALSLHPALDIQCFSELCQQTALPEDYPLADSVRKNVVCYSGAIIDAASHNPALRIQLLQEFHKVFQHGPGVLVVEQAYTDKAVLDKQTAIFRKILKDESGKQSGDHFAKVGANGRIWNALQKSALADAQGFIDYYKNPALQFISESWLGPDYQMTAQVNIVYPGGQAQAPHRDYHLGFRNEDVLAGYPPHVHTMSAQLTLQGAVAHTDMPVESGPTLILPFSQQYSQGYLAWRHAEFKDYFEEHAVQLPLKQGDLLFFNPALFHAAGSNHTKDFDRIANLLQVSSAFGRSMEVVDRYLLVETIYPALLASQQNMSAEELAAILGSACEGYAFPTCLDTDPPLNGMSPESQKQLTQRALAEKWSPEVFAEALAAHRQRRVCI